MKELELEFGDLSGHPPPPQVDLATYERWMFEFAAARNRDGVTELEIFAHFMRNEGRQTEPWPDFGG